MSVPGSKEGYPPPAPPVKKSKELLQKYERELRQADAHADQAPSELNDSFDDLVQYLTGHMTVDLQKVRAILMWLSNQNFLTVKNTESREQDEATPRGFLKLVALKKKELVHLFEKLCRKAGVPCVVLSGYCKDDSGDYRTKPASPQVNSHWAAVYTDDQWGFAHPKRFIGRIYVRRSKAVKIETTGQATRARDEEVVRGRLDESYFLPDPDDFIYMCRPQDDDWQLLEGQPWSWTRFIEAPNRRPRSPSPERQRQRQRPKSPPPLPIEELSVPVSERGYPPPSPPKSRKRDIFDKKEFNRIYDRSKSASGELYFSYKDLFGYLFESLDTDVKKAAALLSWLSVNYRPYYYNSKVTKKMFVAATDPNTPVGAIKLRTILHSYIHKFTKEQLFAVLCRQAKLPCVIVRGYKKRADLYKLGDKSLTTARAWTAVYLDGNWRLINVHDAIRHLQYKEWLETDMSGNVRERCNERWTDKMTEFFFLTDPDELIHFCFPDDKRWQLLDQPLTEEQFLDEPWFHPPYFSSPVRLKPGCGVSVQAKDGQGNVMLEGQFTKEHPLLYNLYFKEEAGKTFPDDLQLESYITTTVVSRKPPMRSVFFTLPVTGTYILELINESDETLCKLLIHCFGDVKKNQPFLGSSDIGYGFQETAQEAGLEDSSREEGMIVAREGDKVKWRFTKTSCKPRQIPVPADGEKVNLKSRFTARVLQDGGRPDLSNKYLKVEEEEGELVVEAKVPYGSKSFQLAVQIHARDDEQGLTNAANYLVTSDTGMVAAAAGRTYVEQIAAEMVSATEEDDVGRLEVALRESRYARLHEEQAVEQVNAQEHLLTLQKNACQQAVENGDREALESALAEVHRSQLSYYLHRTSWYEAAEQSLRLLKRQSFGQKKLTTWTETLSQKQVDEVCRLNHPNKHVHTVLTAAFTLLGESTQKLKEWKNVQKLLRVHGNNGVLQRIKNYNRSCTNPEDLKRTRDLLGDCTPQTVAATSLGTAAFYHWVRSVLDGPEPAEEQANQTGHQAADQTACQAGDHAGDQAADLVTAGGAERRSVEPSDDKHGNRSSNANAAEEP